jgi:uncharacterized tellurite resistance protein B-like protein
MMAKGALLLALPFAIVGLLSGCESSEPKPTLKPRVVTAVPPAVQKRQTEDPAPPPVLAPSKIPSLLTLPRPNPAVKSTEVSPAAPPTPVIESRSPAAQNPVSTNSAAPAPAPNVGKTPAAQIASTAAVSAPAASDPAESNSSLPILIVLGIVVGAIYLRYRFSESARAHRQVGKLTAEIEEIVAGYDATAHEMQTATSAAATRYVEAIRKRQLAAVPLDEIRKLAPGARMQPLREVGVTSLLDCEHWTAANFMAFKGIGADSGYRLAAACATLRKSVYAEAIPHPRTPAEDATGSHLLQTVYHQRNIHEDLKEPRAALQAMAESVLPRCDALSAATAFRSWLFGREKKGRLRDRLDESAALVAAADTRGVLESSRKNLSDARSRSRMSASDTSVAADLAQHGDLYQQVFEELLGPDSRPATRTSERNIPPALAATEPVPVTRPAAGPVSYALRGAGIALEIRLGAEEAPAMVPTGVAPADCWIAPGESTVVHGIRIQGPLYVGRGLAAVQRQSIEPALIDPTLKIETGAADCRVRMLDYWSNYSYADPRARASYLQWLATGKCDPAADLGYVFLYFYGLERRALADNSTGAPADIPQIVGEVERLRSVYASNRSFNTYSASFLDYLASSKPAAESDVPPTLVRYNLPYALRFKLGQFAAQKEPLPANWAHAWHYCDPRTRLPAAAERCPEYAQRLFALRYRERFGAGLILPPTRTRLKITYRPASASFGGPLVQAVNLPDVSVLTSAYTKIDMVAAECFQALDPYSRYIGRNREVKDALEARLLLPFVLWPAALEEFVRAQAAASAETKYTAIRLGEILGPLEGSSRPTRAQYISLTRTLAAVGIGLEPDLRFTKEIPELNDPVAVFQFAQNDTVGAGFGLASVIVQLAGAVASADGEFSDAEATKLHREIQNFTGLEDDGRRRLLARMATYRLKAPTTNGVRAALQPLDKDTREKVTDILIGVISGEGLIEPAEVSMLEKIYSLLGLDTAILYPRLHGLEAAPSANVVEAPAPYGSFRMDPAKIARLRASSDEVTKKLAAIFVDEPAVQEVAVEAAEPVAGDSLPGGLPQLDRAHAELLTIILGRAEWTRAEFEEVCADKGLMPDGAMERINDAAFTRFDEPLISGEDPLEISVQLFKETTA